MALPRRCYLSAFLVESFRFRLWGEAQRKLGSREEEEGAGPWRTRRRTVAAAMALPGSLNRYLLLMAQEHLEFRLPVSDPGVPGAEARTPRALAWESLRAAAHVWIGARMRPLAGPSPQQPFAGTEPCRSALCTCSGRRSKAGEPDPTQDGRGPWGRSVECEGSVKIGSGMV